MFRVQLLQLTKRFPKLDVTDAKDGLGKRFANMLLSQNASFTDSRTVWCFTYPFGFPE